MARQRIRPGLSLLEVVIVFTIIGTLFALLLPGIQRLRSLGTRANCAGNLRKIGAAAIQYHDSHGVLPPGSLGPKPNGNMGNPDAWQEVGCLVHLLPYLDGGDVYQRLQTNLNVWYPPEDRETSWGNAWYRKPSDWTAAQTKISVFNCPADPNLYDRLGGFPHGVAILMHMWDKTITMYYFLPPNDQMPWGRTNYSGVAGANGKGASKADSTSCPADFPTGGADLTKYEGLFTNRSVNSLRRVPDGASNTLMFGEGIGGQLYAREPRDFAWSWMGVGTVGTKHGLGREGYPYGPNRRGASWSNFSSRHPDGVNFCFADGSVRMIPFGRTYVRQPSCSQDWYLLQALAGYRDGEIPGP